MIISLPGGLDSAIISLSGGLDSATLLAYTLHFSDFKEVCCVSFNYGSKHNKHELNAAENVYKWYKQRYPKVLSGHTIIDVSPIFAHFKSHLLLSGDEIPEGHYNDESMKQTVVPARNIIFISILAGIAESLNVNGIALAVHQGDHYIYPDCRPSFMYKMQAALICGTDGKISLYAPFLHKNKQEILEKGIQLEVPYHLTRTCYKDQPIACGKCGSCVERLEAFKLLNLKDPIEYDQ